MTTQHTVVVANGALTWTPTLVRLCRDAALVVAADGGANHLARIEHRPDRIVGDLDSVTAATCEWVGDERVVPRLDQDRTDLEKALDFVLAKDQIRTVVVLGALGHRTDHLLGNVGLLCRLDLGPRLLYRDAGVRLLATSEPIDLPAEPGETWSFMTFDPTVRVTLEGVRWPVSAQPLHLGGYPSISNEAADTTVRIAPTNGSVIVTRYFDDSQPQSDGTMRP